MVQPVRPVLGDSRDPALAPMCWTNERFIRDQIVQHTGAVVFDATGSDAGSYGG
jgi:hypothetical protein